MFFILSKTAAFLLLPSNLLIAIGLLGVVLLATRFRRAGLRLVISSVVILVLLGFSPLGGLLTYALESRFPAWDPSRGAPDGVVVLGGGIASSVSRDNGDPVLNADAGRITAIAKLARAYPNARIVYSNGDPSLFGVAVPDGALLYQLLDSFGVARARVVLETKSRNTHENAVFSKAMMNPKPGERWLVVTSAQHMPRAIGCFRQAGFAVEAYPVAWRTQQRPSLKPGGPFGAGLYNLDNAVHEWLGLLAYWLTGRTSELLPGPQ
jgi:uncharacterized SAM-binding protein YcdF (DUF218 family)